MKHFFCYMRRFSMKMLGVTTLGMKMLGVTMLSMVIWATPAEAQIDSLHDEDIITIKKMAEKRLSDYQEVMNRLIAPNLNSIIKISIIKDGMALFTENARIEVDYDTAYFPPNLTYEVDIQKYLGDFATYHEQREQVIYTDRLISPIKWKSPENFYYLTLNFTSLYDDLPSQSRVATIKATREGGQWHTAITYVKFKASPGSPLTFMDINEEVSENDSSVMPATGLTMLQEAAASQNQIFLNNLASGGKRGKRYLIGWRLPQDEAVSVQLLSQNSVVETIITGQEANILQWTINPETKPGKYQIKVLDKDNRTSITSPAFRINRRFPMALRIGLGVAAGFYVAQAIRNDWNFGWPFDNSEAPPGGPQPLPDLPGPPGLPE